MMVLAFGVALVPACAARAADSKPADKGYALAASVDPKPVGVGKPCRYALSITPATGWQLKTATPLKVQLNAPAGLAVDKKTLTWEDLQPQQGDAKAVGTGCKGIAAGEHKLGADVTFFLCNDEICQRHVDKIELAVRVE